MPTSVVRIHESMRGAPNLTGQAGSRVNLLTAFLVDGWGLAPAVSASVSGGVATVTLGASDVFEDGCVVEVAGATPGALNGRHRIATANGYVLTYPTAAPDGAASGSITVKYAPAGWERVFTGTNQAVYRSQNVASPRRYLRVVDTATQWARVTAYNTMTSVSAGTGPFPTGAQISGGGYWHGSQEASSQANRYDLIGDDRLFYFAPAQSYLYNQSDSGASSMPWYFGEPLALRTAGDAWCTVIGCSSSSYFAAEVGTVYAYRQSDSSFAERVVAGTGGGVPFYMMPETQGSAKPGADGGAFGIFPDVINGRLKLARIYGTVSVSDSAQRFIMPGAWHVPQGGLTIYSAFSARDTVPGPGALSDRRFMLLWVGGSFVGGGMFFDISGPWR